VSVEESDLPFAPSEDPFVIEHGGFYRRWLSMIDDLDELRSAVDRLTGTTDDVWVPVWRQLGSQHEEKGDRLDAGGDGDGARREYLLAKTYYSIGRFPDALTPSKTEVSADCVRAYLKAAAYLDPPLQQVEVVCDGKAIPCHYRVPAGASPSSPVAAVLIMCGADVFKEDRGWAAEYALASGLASLVMDAPGTNENPFPYEPESVKAWMAAVDWLADRPEVAEDRIGAFGISRGGYSVMQLAGTYPERVMGAVAIAGNHFGYQMSPEEAEAFVVMQNVRSTYVFGAPGDGPTFKPTTLEDQEELFRKWSLTDLGIADAIVCPVLMINGKRDHLAPIGNIYSMLEHGPVTGREARVYPDDGHCAFKHRPEWGPESFDWLARKLA
jgi:pimeloyl-ACP methyl ester carboxylesterase